MWEIWEIYTGIAVVIILWIIFSYNSLIRSRNMTSQAWAGIDVQLKRRSDLIPNLTKVVAGYATHEKILLTKIAQLRAQILAPQQTGSLLSLDSQMSAALKQLFAVAENYPKLQANQNYLELQKELVNTENQIAAMRRIYNENVTIYNTAVETFPTNILATICRFSKKELYKQ